MSTPWLYLLVILFHSPLPIYSKARNLREFQLKYNKNKADYERKVTNFWPITTIVYFISGVIWNLNVIDDDTVLRFLFKMWIVKFLLHFIELEKFNGFELLEYLCLLHYILRQSNNGIQKKEANRVKTTVRWKTSNSLVENEFWNFSHNLSNWKNSMECILAIFVSNIVKYRKKKQIESKLLLGWNP